MSIELREHYQAAERAYAEGRFVLDTDPSGVAIVGIVHQEQLQEKYIFRKICFDRKPQLLRSKSTAVSSDLLHWKVPFVPGGQREYFKSRQSAFVLNEDTLIASPR